ncbi:glycosyltransferase family 4 protein [Candidatus Sumerlaeota bacterium]|nr:glycosyltransferase family 4 protein [Candidatus Sumerlaeota bacterium]
MNFSNRTEYSMPETPTPHPAAAPPNSPLRVALDLRLINHSGIGSYLAGLLSGFAEIQAPVQWTFIGPKCEIPASLEVAEWIEFNGRLYGADEFWHYPKTPNVDLIHYPHYNLPLVTPARRVVTVYDLFHLRYGTFAKRLYQRLFMTRLAWSDALVAAISEKTADEIRAASSIAPERIHVIPLGAGRPYVKAKTPRRPQPLKLADGRTINPPWLMALGIDKPHKNIDFLIAAAAMWYLRRGEGPPLIWMGPAAEELQKRILSIPAYSRQSIFIEPYSSSERVEELYAGAMGLVFPSLDEGFGLPPLEAMARGVPVLCSRRKPMTDILGDAPIWFDPDDSATLWRALDMLVDNPDVRKAASDQGKRQAEKYGWARTARETLALYQEAIQSKPSAG